MSYEELINNKITELEQMQKELKKMYTYYIKMDMILSLENITKQLYRNEFTINVLKEILGEL
jgi:hypothetical protein